MREKSQYSELTAFGLNTQRYSVSLCIQSKCGKMRARITPNTDIFYAVYKASTNKNLYP